MADEHKRFFRTWGFGEPDVRLSNDIPAIRQYITNQNDKPGLFLFSDKADWGNGWEAARYIVWSMLKREEIKECAYLLEMPAYLISDDTLDIPRQNEIADIVVYDEIAPAKYNYINTLKVYSLLSRRAKAKKRFIITSSLRPEEIVEHVGVPIAKLITMNCTIVEL